MKFKDVLSKVFDYRGKTPKKLGLDWTENGDILAISAKNIKKQQLVNLDKSHRGDEGLYHVWMKDGDLQPGDVLLTSEAPLGESYQVKHGDRFIVSQRVFGLRPNTNLVDVDYFAAYLSSNLFRKLLDSKATGTTVLGIKQSELLNLDIELPDINTQKKIGTLIRSLNAKIEITQLINDNLAELITVMFDQSKDAWPTAALGSLLHPESNSIQKKEQKKARFLNTGDVTNGVFNNVDLRATDSMPGQAKKLINKDDILYSEIRPVNRHFGLVRLDKPEEYVVSTKLMVLRRNEDVQLPVEYLYFLLTSVGMIREMQFEAESRSGTFPQITFDVIKGYQVPVPPTNHPILGLIKTAINNKIDNDTESALLAEARDTLLNELLH
ncbi:restriction endonuclease subunit S [Weissella confusa]|uniref:restriction endonuclease subunit S n=1 Tax=Weissella confusa TaxID=1583 RepID=UPI0021AFC96B|nr:restriction endonuclease subunit S [Weissella confusa]MCT0040316.1 restriction endonuclease subunit S [Weissella confusa]